MRKFTWLAAAVIVAAALIPPAEAGDFRDEIIMNVVDPCILTVVRSHPKKPSLSDDVIVDVVKAATQGSLERMVETATPALVGKNEADRLTLYDRYLKRCIASNATSADSQADRTTCKPASTGLLTAAATRCSP